MANFYGTPLADHIYGTEDGDVIDGSDGDDTLVGLGGNDVLIGGSGFNSLIGGEGQDTYLFFGLENSLQISNISEDQATDLLVFMNHPSFTIQSIRQGNDLMLLSGMNSSITIFNYYDSSAFRHLDVQFADIPILGLNNFAPGSTITSSGILNGTIFNDTLTGSTSDDTLYGDAGRDQLYGGDGSDHLYGGDGRDLLSGGQGDDIYYINQTENPTDTILEDQNAGNDTIIIQSPTNTIIFDLNLYNNIENLQSETTPEQTVSHVSFYGNSLNNTITGSSLGNDTLDGRGGDDILIGKDGNDYYILDNSNDIIIEDENEGLDTLAVDSFDVELWLTQYDNVENVTLTGNENLRVSGDENINELIGNNGNNTLNDTWGGDTLRGGLGDDIYEVSGGTQVIEDSNAGTDTIQAEFTSIDLTISNGNIENATLIGSNDFNITGNNSNNILIGNNGSNIIDGGIGNDTLYGDAGIDTLIGGSGDDIYNIILLDQPNKIIELSDGGNDTIIVDSSDIDLNNFSEIENATLGYIDLQQNSNITNLIGDGKSNLLTGNIGNNYIHGGAGNDQLNGDAGNDTLIGGDGLDTYLFADTAGVDAAHGNDTIILSNTDTIADVLVMAESVTSTSKISDDLVLDYGVNNKLTIQNYFSGNTASQIIFDIVGVTTTESTLIQSLNIDGSQISEVLQGTSFNDVIHSQDGADTLYGLAGQDTLYGEAGNDVLEGGEGNDALYGGLDDDIIKGHSGNDTLYGDVGNDQFKGGLANDTMYGGIGNDVFFADAGADTMYGGIGNDYYFINGGDTINENADEGTDTVNTSADYTLSANLENLIIRGAIGRSAIGNELANSIAGSTGNDTIYGMAGNDVLNGGIGTDTLYGGLGNDRFVIQDTNATAIEALGEGSDQVDAFVDYTLGDHIEIMFLKGTAISGTGNSMGNQLYGTAGNNTLSGLAGHDYLNGQAGADTLIGGDGSDNYALNRTSGADTLIENGEVTTNNDAIKLSADIAIDQVWFSQSGNDLVVSIIGTNNSSTIKDYYLGSNYQVERVIAANGQDVNTNQIQTLVNAMSSMTPPALGQTSLDTDQQTVLNSTITAAWG